MSETLESVAAEAAPGDDLDSIISSAWDTAEAAAPSEGAARDERGRFASTSAPEDGSETDETTDTDQPEAKADGQDKPATEPPQSWSDAEKATWSTLSPAAQETILRRERDVEAAFADRANEQRMLSSIKDVLAPHQSRWAMQGLTEVGAIQSLASWEQALATEPEKAFPKLAEVYGFDLRRLGLNMPQTGAQQTPQMIYDPRLDQLLAERQQEKAQQTLSTIKAFETDPAHPHFADVRTDMGRLIAANPDLDLKEAYRLAVAASPAIQAKVQAEAAKAAADKARKEAADKAAAARRAGVGVRDSATGTGRPASGPARSLEEQLERAWAG